MKVVLVEPGGYAATFHYTHNLAEALAARGHEVLLATGLRFETRGLPRRYEAVEAFDRWRPRPLRLARLARRVRAFRPDIVHIQGHLHPTSYLGIHALLRRAGAPAFVYTAQDVEPKVRRPHHPWALRRLYRAADAILVNAEHNRRAILDRYAVADAKVTTIPMADLTAFVPRGGATRSPLLPAGRRVVLFFGNIEPRKGVAHLLRSFGEVRARVPDAFLLVVGKPFEDVAPYERLVAASPARADISFRPGYLPYAEIPRVLGFCDLVVLPYTQGWNSALAATAYSYGKPVVASDLGGLREVVEEGATGFLVPPGDEAALAGAIVRALTDPLFAARWPGAVAARAREYSWPETARRVEEVYARLLEARATGGAGR
jgi:glycosyltransferase involved in cell wall biosynthesis